jgi:hypothetical protein
MRDRNVLHPAEIDDVADMILSVDVGREHRYWEFESRGHKIQITEAKKTSNPPTPKASAWQALNVLDDIAFSIVKYLALPSPLLSTRPLHSA